MAKHTIPLRITIEVDDEPPQPDPGIRVREVPGGQVLDVPQKLAAQLTAFGWLPPVAGA